jgi:hypothetical protein
MKARKSRPTSPCGEVGTSVPIVILCPTVWSYRNVVVSGILQRLEENGLACHLLLGKFGEALLADADERIEECAPMRPALPIRSQRGKAARNSLLQASFARRYGLGASAILTKWQNRDETTWLRPQNRVVNLLSTIASREPFYSWQVASAERFVERTRDMGPVLDQLRQLRPRLLVSTECTVSAEIPYVLCARRLGITTVGWILSFDNLTSRSVLPVFDHYLAWNERMRSLVLRLYPDRIAANVHVTGTPQFDFHVDEQFRRGRAETLRELGLETGSRYVVWAANSRVFTPTEPELVAAFLQRAGQYADLREHRVVVRLHPLDDYGRWEGVARLDPRLVVKQPWARTGLPPGAEAQTRLVSTLLHADACINVASTMSLDAAVLDVPVICAAFALGESGAEHDAYRAYYATDHFRPIVESGGVRIAASLDDLLIGTVEAVRDPYRDRVARARLVEAECGQVDGAAGLRVAATLAGLAACTSSTGDSTGQTRPGAGRAGRLRSQVAST